MKKIQSQVLSKILNKNVGGKLIGQNKKTYKNQNLDFNYIGTTFEFTNNQQPLVSSEEYSKKKSRACLPSGINDKR